MKTKQIKEKKKSTECVKCKQSISRLCYTHLVSEFPERIREFGWMVSTSFTNRMEGRKLCLLQDFLVHPAAFSYKSVKSESGEFRKRMLKMWVPVLPLDGVVAGRSNTDCTGTDVCYMEVNRGKMCPKHQKIIDAVLGVSTVIK